MKVIIDENRNVTPSFLEAGNEGENIVTILEFEYPKFITAMIDNTPQILETENLNIAVCFSTGLNRFALPLVNKKLAIPFDVSKAPLVRAYLRISTIENEDVPIWKSNVFNIIFNISFEINRNGDVSLTPTDLERINQAILDLQNQLDNIEIGEGIQGPEGPQGPPGNDGITPIRGIDYFTLEDQEAMINEILSRIPVDISLQNRLEGLV